MSTDNNNKDWSGLLLFSVIFCALGWYSAASGTQENTASYDVEYSEIEYKLEEANELIEDYEDALYQANENIEESRGCIEEAFYLIEDYYYIDALYMLDGCRVDTVYGPG